jgi:lysophospholipase L1-like esterase
MRALPGILFMAVIPAGLAGGCSSSSGTPDLAHSAASSSGSSSGSVGNASSSGSSGPPTDTAGSGSSGGSSGGTSVGSSSSSPGTGSSSSSSGGSSGSSSGVRDSGAPPDSSTHPGSGGSGDGGGTSPGGGNDAGHPPPHTGVWHITPIGDSITQDTCGPQLLSQELIKNGHTNFTFVGTQTNNQSCSGAPNVQSEGHGGYLVTDLLPAPHKATLQDHSAELPMWATNDKSDLLLMQFGTNDAWNGVATQTVLDAYTLVLTDYRAVNPNVILFVAQITPLNPAGCGTCEKNAETLNAAIPGWATSQSTTASPIYVVNVWSAFTASAYTPNSTYTADGVHPNPAGGALVAQKWYEALTAQGIP